MFSAAGMFGCAVFVEREHGLALLSPYGSSLLLGVELPLDAFFVYIWSKARQRGTNGSNPFRSSGQSGSRPDPAVTGRKTRGSARVCAAAVCRDA